MTRWTDIASVWNDEECFAHSLLLSAAGRHRDSAVTEVRSIPWRVWLQPIVVAPDTVLTMLTHRWTISRRVTSRSFERERSTELDFQGVVPGAKTSARPLADNRAPREPDFRILRRAVNTWFTFPTADGWYPYAVRAGAGARVT